MDGSLSAGTLPSGLAVALGEPAVALRELPTTASERKQR